MPECPIGSYSTSGASTSSCTGVCVAALPCIDTIAACVAGYYCPSVGLTTYTANRASGGAWRLARCARSMHGRQLLPGWRVCDDWCECASMPNASGELAWS